MSSPNKLAMAVGFKADGSVTVLYAGLDAEAARDAFQEAQGFELVRCFRQLRHVWKQRKGDTAKSTTIDVTEPEPLEAADFEPVIVADEQAPAVDEAAELVGGATEPVTAREDTRPPKRGSAVSKRISKKV